MSECSCIIDQETHASVAFEPAFCEETPPDEDYVDWLDVIAVRAQSACGWDVHP